LVRHLRRLVADGLMRREFGANSAQLVASYSVAACADGITRAAAAAKARVA
jgi:hypothetical protein